MTIDLEKEKQEFGIQDYIKIEHIALRQVYGSRLLNMHQNYRVRAQNKMIPIMDSKCNINGSHYMQTSRKEVFPGKIHIKTIEEGLEEGLGKTKNAKDQEIHKTFKDRAGEVVSVQAIYESGHIDVMTFDLKKFNMIPLEAFK